MTAVGRASEQLEAPPPAGPLTWTPSEAHASLGVDARTVRALARAQRVEAVLVDGAWLVDGDSLAAWLACRPQRPGPRHLDAGPLLRQVALAGGDAALGVHYGSAAKRALERARERGWVTPHTADQLATSLLGLTLWELWDGV